MVSEFDLPCVDCGTELQRETITAPGEELAVATCPACGGRYYPESTLSQL